MHINEILLLQEVYRMDYLGHCAGAAKEKGDTLHSPLEVL
jgi:hypothetical protein